ncbi:hypothetical protein UFOVP713_10 [uncultured Caudovirales phage]|uniref:Uncharacterized protein n=1 Tax=uncultured Caudovirales phage TaxID=2100421 RepID=A0A6J5NFR3_9CAUD|nr:hypothetical protein UFOVP713_10 [uncultured Caudovirales phage]
MPMPAPQVSYDLVYLKGGLDLITPTLALPAGVAREAFNFEASITGGYTRIAGYERFDGRPAPSAAIYGGLSMNLTGSIVVGNTIVGVTSGSSGVVIAVVNNDIYYTKATGPFLAGETIQVSAVNKGTIASLQTTGVLTAKQQAQFSNLAADVYRADIGAVPGSGPVRGVIELQNVIYAWRNNVGGTAMAIYKSSATGWTSVALGFEMSFNTGTAEIFQGNTVTGATSGFSAVVTRVVLESGSWGSGTAAGRLIFASATGTFTPGENLQVAAANKAVCVAAQTAITLLPDGRVELVLGNFGGVNNQLRAYGCDGVNRGFEFDGMVYVPIKTGMATDVPTRVTVHKQHLFFAFGTSVQFSGLGEPYQWTPLLGAGEIVQPEPVTCFVIQPGDQSTGALAIYSDNYTYILYGTDSSSWNLVPYNTGAGAKPYSGQNLAQTYVFDDRGVITLQATLSYGNFDTAAVTLNIRPFTQVRRNLVTASVLNREKAQYRIFFSDGFGLYVTIANGQMLGAMPVSFPNSVFCATEAQTSAGEETSFFGSTNGFVYALDAGTSFDGESINSRLELNYNSENMPRILKRYRRGSFELTGNGYCEFQFAYDLGYSSLYIGQTADVPYENSFSSSFWDSVFWDAFVWDGRTLAPTDVEIRGTGQNILLKISSDADYFQPFTINSVILHYTARRGLR